MYAGVGKGVQKDQRERILVTIVEDEEQGVQAMGCGRGVGAMSMSLG